MPSEVRGVVSRGKGEPVGLETVVVPDPGPGEALVDVQACGVCHTDLHYKEGGIGTDFPYLLGHEAAGVVSAVGPGVTEVAPGDFVILNWRAVCGNCRACRRGRPWYCFNTFNATQKMTLADGTPLSPALGIGAFAEKTLVAAGQCTKVDPEAPATVAGLLGCGVMAGIGAAINTGAVGRGDSVAVFGCGGVGDAAIAGAALAGATTIIGVDVDDRKLGWAREFGATHTVNSRTENAVARVQALTGGGVHYAFEAYGAGATTKLAVDILRKRGTAVIVGISPNGDTAALEPVVLTRGEKTITGCYYGSAHPRQDMPRIADWAGRGLLDVSGLVTRRYPLAEINRAYEDIETDGVGRGVLVF